MESTQAVMNAAEVDEVLSEASPTLPIEVDTEPDPVTAEVPRPPESLADAGLTDAFVAGLVLKALNVRGAALGFDLVDMLALPMALLDDVIQDLQERRLVEVHSTRGPRRGEWVFKLTSEGQRRAAEELELCRYVGPAPVPFEDFQKWIEVQAAWRPRISEDDLLAAMDGIVLPESLFDILGPAINSGRSLFLHGAPGNGKTLLADRIAGLFGEGYYVPYAVLVDGSVMVVHDPVHHRDADGDEGDTTPAADHSDGALEIVETNPPLDDGAVATHQIDDRVAEETRRSILRALPEHDRRYAQTRRPVVVTGGELTLDQLELQWDASSRMYQAPPQLKAAGGVLVVDDLGRQRVPVSELLNRWVVPLEQRRDYLSLRSGRKVVVPFDAFVIFSTNLEPESLADEAFLRRIHYKIEVPDPDRAEYELIFRSCCEARGVDFDEAAIEQVYGAWYGEGGVAPRRCHPRDVLDHLCDIAGYRGEPPRLTDDLLEQACKSYFLTEGGNR